MDIALLIMGGRQSAFESAALLAEAGGQYMCAMSRDAGIRRFGLVAGSRGNPDTYWGIITESELQTATR